MDTHARLPHGCLALLVLLPLAGLGCSAEPTDHPAAPSTQLAHPDIGKPVPAPAPETKASPPPEPAREPADTTPGKKAALGPNVWLETQGDKRRVLVGATVCLRQGNYGLETLLCRNRTKEHESILTTDADARTIHGALVVARARPGSPVQFDPKFKPPTGSRIRVSLRYEEKGKTITVPAGQWITNVKTRKELDADWVFAGSELVPNPDGDDKPPLYAANLSGAYICVTNVPTAMLDLPVASPKALEDRVFDMNTERIPPVDTKVILVLEPG